MKLKIITICLIVTGLTSYAQLLETPDLKIESAVGKNDNNGQKSGLWEYFREDNSLSSRAQFEKGKKHGVFKMYWKNGNLYKSANYINGKKEGVEKIYYEDGSIAYSNSFENNLRNGEAKSYSNNGSVLYNKNYKNDLLHGSFLEFNRGDIYKNGNYVNGERHGKWMNYYKGVLDIEAEYQNGIMNGLWKKRFSYHDDLKDKVEYEYQMLSGKLVNPIKIYEYTDEYSENISTDPDKNFYETKKYYWLGNVETSSFTPEDPFNPKQIGEWNMKDMENNLIITLVFDIEGVQETKTVYFDNGELKAKHGFYGEYEVDGSKISNLEYFPNGKLKAKTVITKSQLEKVIRYYENGAIRYISEHDILSKSESKINWGKEYNEDGTLNIEYSRSKTIFYYKGRTRQIWFETENGKWYGKYILYHANGNGYIEEEGHYSLLKNEKGYDESYKMGVWYKYYDNGKLKNKGNYLRNERESAEGLKDGTWKYYNEEGDLIKTENYSNGIKQ
jgi:antitoxin component YwqK of YwqJK toxin-antitoxin module